MMLSRKYRPQRQQRPVRGRPIVKGLREVGCRLVIEQEEHEQRPVCDPRVVALPLGDAPADLSLRRARGSS
eukprot:4462201-Pleurochrysis_carterae.AAC.1